MRATLSTTVRSILVVTLATAAFTIHGHAQAPTADPEVQAQIDLFSAWIEGQIEIRGLPGIVVGVVSGDDLVWARGFGHADVDAGRPMATDTRFRMASHSKLFTATSIMQLREQGKVRLDDPVIDYLPWFTFGAAASDDPPVTIEQLLTHSSGLPREAGSHWTDFDFPTPEEVRWRVSRLLGDPPRLARMARASREFARPDATKMIVDAVASELVEPVVGRPHFHGAPDVL